MTDKLDIPALADAIDPRIQWPDSPANWQVSSRVADLIAASDALRSLTTALEIGRAMGIEAAAKYHDIAARDIRAAVDEPNFDGNERLHLEAIADHEMFADHIRALSPAVDLEGLTERIAKLIADEDGNLALFDQGRNLLPGHGQGECDSCDGKRDNYRRLARAVLSSLGLHAREN